MAEPIYLEAGAKRTFAGGLEWPGWCRGGKSEEAAVAALVASGPRYAAVLASTGLRFEPPIGSEGMEVTERLGGDSGTDFGVPSRAPAADQRDLGPPELERQVLILGSAWAAFDRLASGAVGHALRLGPRGGGRDLDRIVDHVRESEASYLVQLGARAPRLPGASSETAWAALRERALETLRARAAGIAVEDANRVARPWSPRYHVRRAAWHVLDHAWEIEDRVLP